MIFCAGPTHRDVVEVPLVHQLVPNGGQVADLALQVLRYHSLHAGALFVQPLALRGWVGGQGVAGRGGVTPSPPRALAA